MSFLPKHLSMMSVSLQSIVKRHPSYNMHANSESILQSVCPREGQLLIYRKKRARNSPKFALTDTQGTLACVASRCATSGWWPHTLLKCNKNKIKYPLVDTD